MAKNTKKLKIEKALLRPKERAPIKPTKKFEDKSRKTDRKAKHKTNLKRVPDQEGQDS